MYAHLEVERDGPVATVWLNRPEKLNALSEDMWDDLPRIMDTLGADGMTRAVVIAGRGAAFTAGIDVGFLAGLAATGPSPAATSRIVYDAVLRLQGTFTAIAGSHLPVIAAVHGYCLGAGMSLVSACDIRLAAGDAVFGIRETRMGLVADVGALQRLPDIIGTAATTEMALTGDDYPASWALERGLVSAVHDSLDQLHAAARDLAARIARNSPLVMEGVKRMVQANRGSTVGDALDAVARWNSSYLISNDLREALDAFFEGREPRFTGE